MAEREFAGKVALVTGTTGIGRAALAMFRAQGDDVLLADIDAGRGAAACGGEVSPGHGTCCGQATEWHLVLQVCERTGPGSPLVSVRPCPDLP